MHKTKQIVWHKKSGKFISSKVLKPHLKSEEVPSTPAPAAAKISDKRKEFAKKFSLAVKKAVWGEKHPS